MKMLADDTKRWGEASLRDFDGHDCHFCGREAKRTGREIRCTSKACGGVGRVWNPKPGLESIEWSKPQ